MMTKIVSAFPGTGKTYFCFNSGIKSVEIEYWKYDDDEIYISDIMEQIGNVSFIFISTDPKGLELLKSKGYDITLIYPENNLRCEYLDRYIERDSPYDFIGTFMKYWNLWLDELKSLKFCEHIVLKEGQFLQNVI